MEVAKLSLSEALAAMATGAEAARKAAGITETGGVPACEPAWRGEGSSEEKQRLRGSIVALKSGKFAYLPVASASSVVKMFGTRDGDSARTAKVKISFDGSESGTFHSSEEAESLGVHAPACRWRRERGRQTYLTRCPDVRVRTCHIRKVWLQSHLCSEQPPICPHQSLRSMVR